MRSFQIAALALLPALLACGADTSPAESQAEDLAASPSRLLRKTYASPATGGERDYYLYQPTGYGELDETRWPILLFLHGGGERGDAPAELDYVLRLGPLYEAWIQKRDLPFLILAPQLPIFGRDKVDAYLRDRDPSAVPRRLDDGVPARPPEFPTPRPMAGARPDPDLPWDETGMPDGWPRLEEDLLLILERTLREERADPDRVYLTGASYGGFGTWYIAGRHPHRFAAISPVVGWGHPDLMAPLAQRQMPIWVFAGGRDRAVPARYFYPGLNALERLGHEDVRFTVHEDMAHDVWARVYAGQDLYDWLLTHQLGD